MTQPGTAGASAPEPVVATQDGDGAAEFRAAAARMLGIPEDQVPSAGALIAALQEAADGAGVAGHPGQYSAEDRAAYAGQLRAEAEQARVDAIGSAEHTRAQGQSLIDAADAMAAKADADYERLTGIAGRVEAGELHDPPDEGDVPAGEAASAPPVGEPARLDDGGGGPGSYSEDQEPGTKAPWDQQQGGAA